MTATLNARAGGLWRNAEGLAVTVIGRSVRAVTVEISEPYGGYKSGAHVALPAAWVTEDAAPDAPSSEPPRNMHEFVFDFVSAWQPDLVAAAIAAWKARS